MITGNRRTTGKAMLNRREALALTGAALTTTFVGSDAEGRQPSSEQVLGVGRGQTFDLDWQFRREYSKDDRPRGKRTEEWRRIDLPHDWSVEDLAELPSSSGSGPFDRQAIGGDSTGYTVGGEGWYRKSFRTDGIPAGHRTEILFHGVAVASEVWINGHKVGGELYPYAPFVVDLTPYLLPGRINLLAVRVKNLGRNTRWYVGSGIYREVEVDVFPADTAIERWGVAAWTSSIGSDRARVQVKTHIAAAPRDARLRTTLVDQGGRQVAIRQSAAAAGIIEQTLDVPSPALWSPRSPALYTLVTELMRNGRVYDRSSHKFGLRIITMDAAEGLRINGERLVLQGGCIHHDNGLLGAASFGDADDRRIRLLKARGFNAIRSSHNPAAPSLRNACDRHGMLLIEEAFDVWHVGKKPDDYSADFPSHWLRHLHALVAPARNSPSVFMWSIGNEIPDRSTPDGMEWSWRLANEVHRLDPTRPVTAAINQWIGHTVRAQEGTARIGLAGQKDQASTVFLDVAGYNYRLDYIEKEHAEFPQRIIYGSETFPNDAWDYASLAQRAPYMLGEFVWTAMDYLGEAGIGIPTSGVGPGPIYPPTGYPQISAYCGDIDLTGAQKPQSYWRDVVWGRSQLEIMVRRPLPAGHTEWLPLWGWSDELPAWTWPGQDGRPLSVRLFTSGDNIRLLLNGRMVAERAVSAKDKMRVAIDVPYAPGTIEAVAFRKGHEIGRRALTTAGTAAKVGLTSEGIRFATDRQRLAFVGMEILDDAGRHLADEARPVTVTVDGPAELVALGSASPLAQTSFQRTNTMTWHGRALAILRSTGVRGRVRLDVRSPGLTGDAVTLTFV